MAEIISAIYVTLSIVDVVQRGTKLLHSVRNTEPRTDQLYYRIISERAITESWANQMRIANGGDLRASVPPDQYDRVVKLLKKLKGYMDKAELTYAEFERKTSKTQGKLASLEARAKFITFGFSDLKDLVDTISIMNKALRAIAPPLPSYAQDMREELSQVRRQIEGPTISPENIVLEPTVTRSQGLPQDVVVEPPGTNQGRPQNTVQRDEESGESHLPTLASMYRLSIEGLQSIATISASETAANIASRLTLWGAGLCDRTPTLDSVLRRDDGEAGPPRNLFLSSIAMILCIEERLLRGEDEGGVGIRHRLTVLPEISCMLGTDELTVFALRFWGAWLEVPTRSEEGPGEETELRSQGPKEDLLLIGRVVENLFDLLPVIQSERRTMWLEVEATERATAEEPESTFVTDSGAVQSASIEENLEQIRQWIKKRDFLARKSGGASVPLYEKVFDKERERLEEFQRARQQQIASRADPAKLVELQDRGTQMANILAAFVTRSQTLSLEEGAASPTNPIEKLDSKDSKHDEKRAKGDLDAAGEAFTAFIDSLRDIP